MQRFRGYNLTEPRYGAVVGYSAFSESYASKSEQVVEYGGLGSKPYKDGKNHQLLQPTWHSGNPKKADNVRPGSAWNNIPPSKNQPGKYNNFSSNESDDDDDHRDRGDDVVCDENGYCYPNPKHAQEYDHYAPNYGYATTHENPINYKSKPNTTPPPQSSYYEKPNPNGNDYTTPHPQPYYEKRPNPNGNDYSTPHPQPYYEKRPNPNGNDYTTPHAQPYYEKRPNPNGNDYTTPHAQPYYKKRPNPNGNDYNTPPPQPYYETPKPNGNGQPYYEAVPNNKAMVHKPLPTIKTRLDRPNKGTNTMESQLENMRINSPKSPYTSSSPWSPNYRPSSRKDYHETIDSAEARRRYAAVVRP